MIYLDSAAPTFAVADVGATARWYREHLGFAASPFPDREPYLFAILNRDGVEIMLLRVEGYRKPDLAPLRPAGMWDAYVRVRGVKSLALVLRGQEFVSRPLTKQPYGAWEFDVRDPNGYVLVFGELTD